MSDGIREEDSRCTVDLPIPKRVAAFSKLRVNFPLFEPLYLVRNSSQSFTADPLSDRQAGLCSMLYGRFIYCSN